MDQLSKLFQGGIQASAHLGMYSLRQLCHRPSPVFCVYAGFLADIAKVLLQANCALHFTALSSAPPHSSSVRWH